MAEKAEIELHLVLISKEKNWFKFINYSSIREARKGRNLLKDKTHNSLNLEISAQLILNYFIGIP